MSEKPDLSFNKVLWPVYILNGIQSIAFGSFIVLVVPLSFLMWPNDPYHGLEIGFLLTTLYWSGAFCGLLVGRMIDRFSRVKIIFIVAIGRGIPVILLGFAPAYQGFNTFIYFWILIFIFGCSAGGMYPAVISLSNDIVPIHQRSRFFGYYEIVRNISTVSGFLIATSLVQNGYWRELFWGVGIVIIIMGIITLIYVDEGKRGAMHEELSVVLQDESIVYDFEDKKLTRKTMFSKTNKAALIEGLFTMMLMTSINILILPYIQSEPHNIAPFSTAVFLVTFGLTAGLLGSIVLARLCDKYAKNNPIRRIPLIILSIVGGLATFALFFFIPWPHLTVEQGKDVVFMMSLPPIWLMGIMFFMSRTIFSLYVVNQAPILQEINLPEALGKVTAANQFLEAFGRGFGPLLVGIFLYLTFNNYQSVSLLLILFILPGVVVWLLALKWFPNDKNQIKEILEERAEILKSRKDY
jgi:MFS family permease